LLTYAIIYDSLGNKKEFIKDKLVTSSLNSYNNNKKKIKEVHNSPWWDKECSILVNKRKWAYKKLSKCPSRNNLIRNNQL